MSLFSSIWSGVKSVGKSLLSAFNPFNDDDYRSASREQQDRFKEKIEVIAKDEKFDHEYRMEAQRVLAKIESYRHAEEMARIEGTTKITLAKINAINTNLEYTAKKEIALIQAIERTPSYAPQLLRHLEKAEHEKQEILQHINKDEKSILLLDFDNAEHDSTGSTLTSTLQNIKRNKPTIKLIDWAKSNQIPRRVLPRKLTKLLRVKSMDLSDYGLTSIPREFSYLTNLEELKLSKNHLEQIPEELSWLIKLTLLDVRNNPLKKLPNALSGSKQVSILRDNTSS